MADLWNVTDGFNFPETVNKLPEDLKSKLMLIDCELLYGKDDWWMSEVLFTPSEYHLDFLQWILTNFNESLANYFQQPQSSLDSPHEVQAQRILALCSTLGLCDPKDENLIKGKAPYNKLLNFWQHLMDIFLIRTNRQNKVNGNISRGFTKDLSFEEKMALDNERLNSICERDFYGNNAFKVDTSIIPTDLYRKMNLQNEIPNGEELSTNLASINSQFERQELEINNLRQNDPYNILVGGDFANTASKEQNINRVLSDLEKMALQFTQCHEELKPWFKSEPQFKFSTLGQKFQEACDKLEEFTNALNQLSNFKESYHCLDKMEQSLNNGLDNRCVIKDYLGPACDILTS